MHDFVQFYQSGKIGVFSHALGLVGNWAIAEDLTHDAFLRLFTAIQCGNPIQSVVKWTNRVLRNLALNYIAQSHVISRTVETEARPLADLLAHPDPSAEQKLIAHEREIALTKAVERLAPFEKECLLLFAEGCSYQSIANRLDVGYGTTVATIQRALRKVRKELVSSGF